MKSIFLILFFFPLVVNSQIIVTLPVAGMASTSNTSSYAMAAFTPSANSLLVVMVVVSGSVTAAPTITGGGLTWTLEASSVSPSANGSGYHIFWAKVGSNPASTTITFDCSGDNGTGAELSVLQFTGYNRDKTNPIRQTKISAATTTSTNSNITFTNALDPANGYMIGRSCVTNITSSGPTDWTEQAELTYSTPVTNFSTASRAGGESTAGPITFTTASSTWVVLGVEVFVFNRGLPSNFFEN